MITLDSVDRQRPRHADVTGVNQEAIANRNLL